MLIKLIKGFITALGAAVLIIMLAFFIRDISRIVNWSSSGFVLSSLHVIDEDRAAFYGVDPEDFIAQPIPVRGDTLLTIADSTASLQRWIDVLEMPHTPGKEAVITYLHEGVTLATTMKTRPVQRAHFYVVVILQILRVLIFLSFILLAFWAFFKRSDSPGVRTLALYCFSMAAFMGLTYLPMFAEMASFRIPFENSLITFLVIVTVFFSSYWLLLNMVFPRPLKLMQNHPWLAYSLCFLPQLILIAISFTPLENSTWFGYTIYVIIALQILFGQGILRYNHVHTRINLEKRQTKLVFWGSGASLLLFLVFVLEQYNIVPIFRTLPLFSRLMITNIIFLFLLASPISFAYTFRRYRLLEVEARLRRGTQYLLVTGLMLAVFFGLVYLIGVVLLDSVGVTSRTPTLLIALVLALGFAPTQRNLRNQLENRFYPERLKLRRMVNEFLKAASTLPDCASLCGQLGERFRENLGVEAVYPVLRSKRNGSFALVGGESVPVEEDGDLMLFLGEEGYPLFIDEAVASARIRFSEGELNWLESRDIAFILPLKTHAQVQGFLALGHKLDREDFHPEELQILTTLANQVALAIENLSLLEENLEKRRMEEELQIARRVQLRFLPQAIPETPGLEVTASSAFCLEVAGDYYDVIPLEDHRTVLAVGDVSGKGAGAALIMANLQASLRALCGVGLRLADLVARINDIIHGNTDPEQYITFFIGVFDPADKTLTYVNAGHNPPLLVRGGERIESLDVGGTIVGAFPSLTYEQETITLSSGDLLVIYTDGVSEAANEAWEEFGEERIRQVILAHSSAAVKGIMDHLTGEVARFRYEESPGDDMTLLLARVK